MQLGATPYAERPLSDFGGTKDLMRLEDITRTPSYMLLALCGLLPAGRAFGDDVVADSNPLSVDVVVDLTEPGKKVTRPTPANPAYYYPVIKGYTPGGTILAYENAPPPVAVVEHLAAVELAKQGYLLARKGAPPTLLLIFWWGYKAPEMMNDDLLMPGLNAGGTTSYGGVQIPKAEWLAMTGQLPTGTSVNAQEMETLVMGSKYDPGAFHNHPNPRQERAKSGALAPRYYFMVSALDFKSAVEHKQFVVLWTARISTELSGHTLDEALPTLIHDGAPAFGQDTNGPQFTAGPVLPSVRVYAGPLVVKSTSFTSEPPPPSSPSKATKQNPGKQ